ncbi:MAG TPA: POTRA domain-containing protein [Candidatus Angelobacter sp.]
MHQMAIAAVLFSATWVLPAWSQNQNSAEGCDSTPRDDDTPRIREQVVKNANGKLTAVRSRVKEMKVVRLIFVDRLALPLPLQEEIAKSVSQIDYDDNQAGLEELLERTRDAWQEQGYFKVKVEHSGSQTLEESQETRTVAITVSVDAGKQYRLGDIHFTHANWPHTSRSAPPESGIPQQQGQFSPEQLRAFFSIHQGNIFDTHKLQKGIEELRKAYGAKGFINLSVMPSFEVDETKDVIILGIEIEEDKQYRIGKIDVQGVAQEISRQLLAGSGLAPGDVFNTSRLDEFVKRNQSIFVNDARAEDDVERRLDEEKGTVDLFFHLNQCVAH